LAIEKRVRKSSYSIIKESLKSLKNDTISFHDFSESGLLDIEHYRDHIHASAAGYHLLAGYLAQVLQDKNENEMLIVE
jgi:lysophospholipase L1-like esterase